jgi:hypothetical protein
MRRGREQWRDAEARLACRRRKSPPARAFATGGGGIIGVAAAIV